MTYAFNTLEEYTAIRSALKTLSKSLSLQHHAIVCQTQVRNIRNKLKELHTFILDYQLSEEYNLLCEYINYTHCTNFFSRLNEDFLATLQRKDLTLQTILSLLKELTSVISEIEQEIFDINEKYFV